MNGERYFDMLDNFVLSVNSQRDRSETLLVVQDGAPPHCELPVRLWLDSNFPARCIGHREPIELPPCDFFCGVDP